MKLAIVVQARSGSSRLPGKVMMPIEGAPLLQRMLERVQRARVAFELILATTEALDDDVVVDIGQSMGVRVYRGHPTDLLDRHYRAVEGLDIDAVAKIPSDCPLIDAAVIDRVVDAYAECQGDVDYVSNLHPATYPDGMDVEVIRYGALEEAFREAKQPHEREHTTPFFWDQPERFQLHNVVWETGQDMSMSHRFTIDYQADYDFIKAVYAELWPEHGHDFGLREILDLLDAKPDLYQINADLAGVNWYRHHLDDLRTKGEQHTKRTESDS